MVKTKKQMVGKVVNGYGGTNGRKYITIHETANTSKGADAQTHANLQTNGFSASWHWQVDDKVAIQSFPHTAQLWHAGDGKGNGNTNSIGIEICVNSDGNFKQAVKNASELTKKIMEDENISANNVVQHNHWSGKNCPTNLRNGSKGVNWNDFKAMLTGKSNTTSSTPKPSKPKPSAPKVSGSVVDYLKSKGQDSSYTNRKKLATKHGIKGYEGTEAQNIALLNKLQSSSKPKPSNPKAPSMASAYKGKRLESKTNGLRFYNKPSWADKDVVGKVNKGSGFPTIVSRHKVGNSYQYKVKNSKGATYYITASSQFVTVGGASKPVSKPKPKAKSIKVGSKVTVNNSAKFYTTGEKIPNRIKGKTYTVMQVGNGKVLLKEIMSWVKQKDVS